MQVRSITVGGSYWGWEGAVVGGETVRDVRSLLTGGSFWRVWASLFPTTPFLPLVWWIADQVEYLAYG